MYGTVPQDPELYPWCIGDAWMFYDHVLEAANITAGVDIPHLGGYCPGGNGSTVMSESGCARVRVGVSE